MAATPSVVVIPLGGSPWHNFQFTLSGGLYTLGFRFNTRMGRWVMDVRDAQNNNLAAGLPILINLNLSGRFAIPGLAGFFVAVDDTGAGAQPGYNSFGVTHTLWYFDPTGAT
jgi:hypothetical protein